MKDPQSASNYEDRTTVAVKSVLLEIGQVLDEFRGKFVVIGGAVTWLLLNEPEMPHIGTQDVDLSLDAEALGDGEYSNLVISLQKQGYNQRDNLNRFQLVRTVPARDGGPDIDIVVDFLMPRDAEIAKNNPPLTSNFALQRAHGADLALEFNQMIVIEGDMPDGGENSVDIAVASIPAFLAMKGYAINNRLKHKDAYDIYYCIRNFPNGIDALVKVTLSLLEIETALKGYCFISDKFRDINDFGPTSVRKFVESSEVFGNRSAKQWQQDAFGQVNARLSALRLR